MLFNGLNQFTCSHYLNLEQNTKHCVCTFCILLLVTVQCVVTIPVLWLKEMKLREATDRMYNLRSY